MVQSLLDQIQAAFIVNYEPNIEINCLVSLIQISRLIKLTVSKQIMKTFKLRMERLTRFGNYDSNHLEMILRVKKACKAAIRDVNQRIV